MGKDHPLLQTPDDWAAAVAALPAAGPLPVRSVLVPSERHAHALRRSLLRTARAGALAGTRFVGPTTLAREVLAGAGREWTAGEVALRPTRLLALFDEDLPLEYFRLDLVRRTPGWAEAFAGAIGDLEAAGLRPDGLPATSAKWRDLALLWRRVDLDAGPSASAARVHLEAAKLLEAGAPLDAGPILAAVTGHETAAHARFLCALPGATLALVVARPIRDRHLDRVAALYGVAARDALAGAPLPDQSATERDLLARYLFASPDVLAGARPRSSGPDGSVSLEEHAGVEAEVEAAAEWVSREVLERGTPLDEIAVLFPVRDPLASMVASRIGRLPSGSIPVHVAGGLPAVLTAGGARVLALVRALGAHLPAESLADLLPALRAPLGEAGHVGSDRARQVAWSLGTVGGNPARPEGALEWAPRAAAHVARLEKELDRLRGEPGAEAREAWGLRAQLDALRALQPALDALVALARLVVAAGPLAEVAPALLSFVERWLLDPGGAAPIHDLLAGALEGVQRDAVGRSVRGADAVAVVEERLRELRVPTVRFGEPAVYVGTLSGAAGLEFQAVRVIGLSEGSLPSPGREDSVLPDEMRRETGLAVAGSADRVLAQLHAFDRAVRGSSRSIALSAPRTDVERSEREPSSLFVEAGAALGRPDPVEQSVIPGLASLARTSFGPARAGAALYREAHPVTEVQWLDRAAASGEIPPAWLEGSHLSLARLAALRDREGLGPADGILGPVEPFPQVRGLDPARAISASALETLLRCPLGFLYRRVLGWDEPAGVPSLRELDALAYGGLFHEVMERFYAAHGEAFVGRQRTLPHWKRAAGDIASAQFDERMASYPLVGHGIEAKERARLLHDVERFLDYDWDLPLTRIVAVEKAFGTDTPVALATGEGTLYVSGFIDRLDVEGDHTLLRDLKTGKDHPRRGVEEGPTPVRDVQLGLYGMVTRKLAGSWGVPRKLEAAYAYARSGSERSFRADYLALEKATERWLALAVRLLSGRAFPPSPVPEDCAYCPFAPVCGPDVPQRAARAAEDGAAAGAVADFFALRRKK